MYSYYSVYNMSERTSYLEQETYGENILCVQRDLLHDDFVSHRMLKIEPSNFLMMT
jgi:hypothetical protein